MRFLKPFLACLFVASLCGCKMVVLDPSGDVAVQQKDLLIASTELMLLIIIPVMVLTILFAWHYRQSNTNARHEPDWHHSTRLELVIWGAPLLIIICLGALTWMGTHLLDPYRPLDRISASKPLLKNQEPLVVEVVAMDWKWLFFYPQYGIATVNEFAAPVDRPIQFRITASSVMNAFYVPALAGQVYAMPGMESELHAVINKPGDYIGLSSNYSGAGFSGMHFTFKGMSMASFQSWIDSIHAKGSGLTTAAYLKLNRPSENEPVHYYARIDPGLFSAITRLCVGSDPRCNTQMMGHETDPRSSQGLSRSARICRPKLFVSSADIRLKSDLAFSSRPAFLRVSKP